MAIVVTGAVGFISSALISKLNKEGFTNLILVDDFSEIHSNDNLNDKQFTQKINRNIFIDWFLENTQKIDFVYHLGARTDTAEQDEVLFDELNLNYSKNIWKICTRYHIPLIYASSAATYGLGEFGYSDDHETAKKLQPLNPYGWSKQKFDLWVLEKENTPPKWAGIKFFNVYGPNEYHKNRMASVIMHTFNQVNATGGMKMFRSHRPDIKDGYQSRDFVFIKDVIDVLYFMMTDQFSQNGLYNLGTGTARPFLDLVKASFKAMKVDENISFIDTPEDIRENYQYFTEAKMDKLRSAGYDKPFTTLEDGVTSYIEDYLIHRKIL